MIRRRYLLAGFLILIGALAWWSGDLMETPRAPTDLPEAERRIDYYFEDFRMSNYDATGRRNHLLEGRRLEHYQDDGTSSIVSPVLEFAPLDAPSWTVESSRGWLSADNKVVRLEGEVTMVRTAFLNAPPLRIETRDLTIDTQANHASTQEAVRVTSPGLQVDAVGMTTQFDVGLLSLLSEVRGTYVKTPP